MRDFFFCYKVLGFCSVSFIPFSDSLFYDPFLSYPLMGMWIGIVYFRWVDGLLMKWWGREDERDLGKFLWVNEWVLVGVSWQNIGMIRVGPTGKVLLDCERTRVQLLRELILLGGLTYAGQQMGGPRPLKRRWVFLTFAQHRWPKRLRASFTPAAHIANMQLWLQFCPSYDPPHHVPLGFFSLLFPPLFFARIHVSYA